jgi:hypothetical protein
MLVGDLGLAAGDRGAHGLSSGQFCPGNRLEVMPMSPRKAPAVCWRTLGWLAFQPKRPGARAPASTSQDVVGAAGDAVAVASSGSARASMSASGIAASRPMPIIAGATRGEIEESSGSGPNAGASIV